MVMDRSRTSPRMLRHSTAGILACLLGAAALTGCTPTAPPPTPSPTLTAIFASEDEALAAATDVYQQYNATFDEVLAEGGDDMSRMRGLVTEEHLMELDQPGAIDSNDWHTEGVSSFSVKSVASYDPSPSATNIAVNVCRDLSTVRVMDSSNVDVTPDDWPKVVPLTISFTTPESDSTTFLVSSVNSWLEPDPC